MTTAITQSAVARVLGIGTNYKNIRNGNVAFLPQRVALIGQGSTTATYSTTKAQHTSARSVGDTYGYGSPLHLAAKQLLPENGDGIGSIPLTVYPLANGGTASSGTITPSGTVTAAATYYVLVNNIKSAEFVIPAAASVADRCAALVAAINAIPDMPVIASGVTTVTTLTSKWQGVSANAITISVVGSTTVGNTFTLVQPSSGATNPDVTVALNQFGDVWETLVLSCLDIADTTNIGRLETAGSGRWGAITRKPFVAFTGNTAAAVATAITVSNARGTDRVNAQLVAPGSADLPFVVAARQLARIATVADGNPARDYGGQKVDGITPGTDANQWLYADRDTAVKGGSSTIVVRDGVPFIGDVVTFYHPTNDPLPAYRYVCDIVKLQNIIFNLDLIFATDEWNGAPLIPDDQATVNPYARRPRDAKAAVAAMVDSLADNAIISDPTYSKAGIVAVINAQNPKRLDLIVPVKLSGNVNITSIDLNFSFYLGV